MSLEMGPCPPLFDVLNRLIGDTIERCKFSLRGTTIGARLPDGNDIRSSQSRSLVPLTAPVPTFTHHIAHVVECGAEEQVVRANTGGVVAAVADIGISRRPVTVGEKPGDPMRLANLTLDHNSSVSTVVSVSHPLPTVTRSINVFPESPCKIAALATWIARPGSMVMRAISSVSTLFATELPRRALRREKRQRALLADALRRDCLLAVHPRSHQWPLSTDILAQVGVMP